jgi:hypothetical protein
LTISDCGIDHFSGLFKSAIVNPQSAIELPFHGEEVARERAGSSVRVAKPASREFRPGVENLLNVSTKDGFSRLTHNTHSQYYFGHGATPRDPPLVTYLKEGKTVGRGWDCRSEGSEGHQNQRNAISRSGKDFKRPVDDFWRTNEENLYSHVTAQK